MDIQKNIIDKTGVMFLVSGGKVQSQEQVKVVSSKYEHMFIHVQNDFISLRLDKGSWIKVRQSLIVDDGKKYDKIPVTL